jgi:hypothetical protein
MLLAVVRGYVGQQEAHRALSEAEAQAARREAEITAQHLKETHHIAFHDALDGVAQPAHAAGRAGQGGGPGRADPGATAACSCSWTSTASSSSTTPSATPRATAS